MLSKLRRRSIMTEIKYDPVTCYNKLIAAGKRPCPGTGMGVSYHCNDFVTTPAVHLACAQAQADVYTPQQYSEAYNTKKCAENYPSVPPAYDPAQCDEQTFA